MSNLPPLKVIPERVMPKGGRPKGSKNKISASLKSSVLEAFDRLGRVDYLVKIGEEKPELFIPLLAKILPTELRMPAEDLVPIVRMFWGQPKAEPTTIEAKKEDG